MPADTVARIEVALARVVPSVAFRRGLAELAVKSGYKSGTAFGQFIEEDSARWKATIQRAKISVPRAMPGALPVRRHSSIVVREGWLPDCAFSLRRGALSVAAATSIMRGSYEQ